MIFAPYFLIWEGLPRACSDWSLGVRRHYSRRIAAPHYNLNEYECQGLFEVAREGILTAGQLGCAPVI
jgi:hypothetical protein